MDGNQYFNFEFSGKNNRIVIEIQKKPNLPDAIQEAELERFDAILMTFEEVAEDLEEGNYIPLPLVN